MNENSSFVENVLEQLGGDVTISTRRMFGGVGIYRSGVMFALVLDERLYFKVNSANKIDYQEAGSTPFIYERYAKNKSPKNIEMSYWEVPVHILEDRDLLFRWMVKSHEAALQTKANKKPRS
jgi:DNA transformation protein